MQKKASLVVVAVLVLSGLIGVFTYLRLGDENAGLANSPWPCWGHDSRHTRLSSYNTSDVDGTIDWKFQADNGFISGVAVGNGGTVYVSSGELTALNPDGTKKWVIFNSNKDSEKENAPSSLVSAPAVRSDSTIYVVHEGNLHAVNPDGTIKWSFKTEDDVNSFPSIGPDSKVYVSSDNHLYAVKPNGEKRWSLEADGEWFSPSASISSDGTIYITTFNESSDKSHLHAISQEGEKKWSHEHRSFLPLTPVIGPNGTIYLPFTSGIEALNPGGTRKWRYSSPSGNGPVSIGPNGKICVSIGSLSVLDENGKKRWGYEPNSSFSYAASVGAEGTIYVPTEKGRLFAIKPNGTKKWSTQLNARPSRPPVIGSNNIYVGTFNGTLYAFGGVGDNEKSDKLETSKKIDHQKTLGLTPPLLMISIFLAIIFTRKNK